MKTYSSELSKFTKELDFRSIPEEVIKKVKILFLDTIGICIASANRKFFQALLKTVKEMRSRNESTVFLTKEKFPMANAAMENAALVSRHISYVG